MTPNQREDWRPLNQHRYSFWEKHSEEVGMFLWMFALTLAGAAAVLTLDKVARWFR